MFLEPIWRSLRATSQRRHKFLLTVLYHTLIGFASTMVTNQDQEMWVWKLEPESPKGTSQADAEDDWFLLDDKSLELTKYAAEPVMYDDQPTNRAQVATKLLEELDEWIKEGNLLQKYNRFCIISR